MVGSVLPSDAGYAAVVFVSGLTVDTCLNTYVTAYAPSVSLTRTLPPQDGAIEQYRFVCEAGMVQASVDLRHDPTGRFHLELGFVADADLERRSGGLVLDTTSALVRFAVRATAVFTAFTVGDNWQLGIDLAHCSIDGITATVEGDLPPDVATRFKRIAEADATRKGLSYALQHLPKKLLPATTMTVPSTFRYHAMKPVQPNETWVDVGLPTTAPVFFPLDGYVVVAVDVPGYTSGDPHTLANYGPVPYGTGIVTVLNLAFLEQFMRRVVMPHLGGVFLNGSLYLVRMLDFAVTDIDTARGKRPGIKTFLQLVYYSHDLTQFFFQGGTGTPVAIELRGYPQLNEGNKIGFELVAIDADLPAWVDRVMLVLGLVVPPLSFVGGIVQGLLKNAMAEAYNRAHGAASSAQLNLGGDQTLPGTSAPVYRILARRMAYGGHDPLRSSILALDLGLAPQSQSHLLVEVEGAYPPTIDTGTIGDYQISKQWSLPAYVTLRLVVPPGRLNPDTADLFVEWTTYLNGQPIPQYTRRSRYRDAGSTEFAVFPVTFTDINRMDRELVINVHVGPISHNFRILSVDPRPLDTRPLVQWVHTVKYWNGYKIVQRMRKSKIHRAPGRGGCRFSGQWMRYPHSNKFQSLRLFSDLPFPINEIEQHRNDVCDYCFFGGPDKHALGFASTIDLTGPTTKFSP